MSSTHYLSTPFGQTAKERLEEQGFSFPPAPDEVVELPQDVSDLGGEDLMVMFSMFTAWSDYASAQVGLAVIAEREKERALELAEAQAWQNLPKGSVTAAKALIALDDEVRDCRDELDDAHAYRRLITDLAARYERDAAVLSRELTRRTSEYGPKQARRSKWSV